MFTKELPILQFSTEPFNMEGEGLAAYKAKTSAIYVRAKIIYGIRSTMSLVDDTVYFPHLRAALE